MKVPEPETQPTSYYDCSVKVSPLPKVAPKSRCSEQPVLRASCSGRPRHSLKSISGPRPRPPRHFSDDQNPGFDDLRCNTVPDYPGPSGSARMLKPDRLA